MPSGSTAAAVVCSRNWTSMCDKIQERFDGLDLYLMVGFWVLLCVALAVWGLGLIKTIRTRRRAAESQVHGECK